MSNLQSLYACLEAITSPTPNTSLIKEATNALTEKYFITAECIPELVKIIQTSDNANIRQLAAVEFSKRVAMFWTEVPVQFREEIKIRLPEILTNEPERKTRNSIVNAIASMADFEVKESGWPEIIQFVNQCSTSPNEHHRENAILLINVLFAFIIDSYPNEVQNILNLLTTALSDPESQLVRVSVCVALHTYITYLPEKKINVDHLQKLIPGIVKVLEKCIEENKPGPASVVSELFEALISFSLPIADPHFKDLIEFFLSILSNKAINPDIRVSAISVIYMAVSYKRSKISKSGFVKSILQVSMSVLSEEHEDDDDSAPAKHIPDLIAAVADSLAPSTVYPVIGPLILEYINSQNHYCRRAALIALSYSSEGCSENFGEDIEQITPLMARCLDDQNEKVRSTACQTVAFFINELPTEMTRFHEQFMPKLFGLVSDPSEIVREKCWMSIESFMYELEEEVNAYLPILMENSFAMLPNLPPATQRAVIETIGSAASSAGTSFTPYFVRFVEFMKPYLTLVNDDIEILGLRGKALDAVGKACSAVGKELATPYVNDLMNLAFENMNIEAPEMRSSSLSFIGITSSYLGESFVPFLEPVCTKLMEIIQLNEYAGGNGSEDVASDGDDDDVDDQIRTAITEDKESVIFVLNNLFSGVGRNFLPYLEKFVDELKKFVEHFDYNIRNAAITALFGFISTLNDVINPENNKKILPSQVVTLIDVVVPDVLQNATEEDDIGVVGATFLGIEEVLQKVGPKLVEKSMPELCNVLLSTLKNEIYCLSIDDDEEVEDLAGREFTLMSSAADVVGVLAKEIGSDFVEHARKFVPVLCKHYKLKNSETQRNIPIAIFGDLTVGLQGGVTEFTNAMLDLLIPALSDPSQLVRSNAAYATGVLCENTMIDISTLYPKILNGLSPFFAQPSTMARDNACGAVSRMILRNPNACPIDGIVPVLINSIPLKHDLLELSNVYKCLVVLIQNSHPSVQGKQDHIKQIIHQSVTESPKSFSEADLAIYKAL